MVGEDARDPQLTATAALIADLRARLAHAEATIAAQAEQMDDLLALPPRLEFTTRHNITDAELEANPGLVKTMSVRPPMGQGLVRLVRIGTEASQVDLQPCGGTHVARTAEIGRVEFGKIEKKGRQNRRVTITLVE